jgi:hypothetical protein
MSSRRDFLKSTGGLVLIAPAAAGLPRMRAEPYRIRPA